MLSNFTKKYILRRARKEKIIIPQNYREILDGYCKLVESYGYQLKFTIGLFSPHNILGANAGLFSSWSIVATPEWAYQLITNPEAADLAFRITLGHELTHKRKNLIGFLWNAKFYTWVNEVHADFNATQIMFNKSRKALLSAIDFKLNYKNANGYSDKETSSHPSWAKRKYYAENFDFDEKLIQQIANDVKYKHNKNIEKVSTFFQPIKLN